MPKDESPWPRIRKSSSLTLLYAQAWMPVLTPAGGATVLQTKARRRKGLRINRANIFAFLYIIGKMYAFELCDLCRAYLSR